MLPAYFQPARAALIALALAASGLMPIASAQQLDLSLNLTYADPANANSGGAWQLVGKSSGFGIAAVEAMLTNVQTGSIALKAPTGTVNGSDAAGFSVFETFADPGGFVRVLTGQAPLLPGPGEEEAIFYGVGTLANGAPNYPGKPVDANFIGPAFTSLTNVQNVPWAAAPDLFGDPLWNTAAALAGGTFAAGAHPAFYSVGQLTSAGSVFTSLPPDNTAFGQITTVDPVTSTIVRTNLHILGDYNGNLFADAADYTIWRDTLGSTTDLRANGDDTGLSMGVIDLADYEVWKTNFSAIPGSGSGAAAALGAAVPEPATWLLLTIAAGVWSIFRPRALASHESRRPKTWT